MGLLDTLKSGKYNPIIDGLLSYGMTGQGNNPTGTAISTMMQSQQAKAARDKAAAQQAQMTQAFASGSVNPALLANYSAGGGEGSKELIDMYKFGRTPQSVTPGSMIYNPTTGAMTMPAPKMSEGQMWDGKQVSNASGYLEAYGNQKAVDAKNAIDQYGAEQGIGYQYDAARMGDKYGYDSKMLGNQLDADISKARSQGQINYGYDAQKMQDAASLDPMQVYDPKTGNQVYSTRGQVAQGGYQAAMPEAEKVRQVEQQKAQSARFNDYMDKGGLAAKQVGKINQLENLIGSGLRTGSTQPAYNAIGGYLKDVGVDVKGLSENQQAQKMLLQLAQDIPLPPGPASNIDVQQRLQQLPNMTDTPEAFRKSLQTMRSLAELNQDVSAYLNSVGTLTPDIEREINDMYSQWGKGK
jgi:hypothetical protein